MDCSRIRNEKTPVNDPAHDDSTPDDDDDGGGEAGRDYGDGDYYHDKGPGPSTHLWREQA